MKRAPGIGKVEKTSRGFEIIKFTDRGGDKCSLQQSSLADYVQPGISAVWLGVDDANPQVMADKAASVGVTTAETCGWVPYPIPEDVLLSTRMHLDRKQVKKLIASLTRWLETGSFK